MLNLIAQYFITYMRFAYTLLFLFLFISAFSQVHQNEYFFKNNGKKVTTRENADYTRLIRDPDSASVYYTISEFYMNGKPKLQGLSSTPEPLAFIGQCLTYYPNGSKKEVLNYTKGALANRQFYYYANGKLKEERDYLASQVNKAGLIEQLYAIINYADSTGKALVTNGNGFYSYTSEQSGGQWRGNYISEGEVKNGQKHSTWKTSVSKDSVLLVEDYDNGKFISGKATYRNGKTNSYTEPDGLPEFSGGVAAFTDFVGSNLHYPDEAERKGIEGQVLLSFVIEKDGTLTSIKTIGNVPSKDMAKEAMRILKQSPKWIPGRIFGRAVRVQYAIPIVFALR